MADEEAPAVGIDLGTTYSCVAVFQNDIVRVIPNESGHRITPSYVSFTPEGFIVGDEAKYRLTLHPRDTVYEVKRLIGRSFDDPSVARDVKLWPFEVINDNNKPQIVVCPKQGADSQTYTPEEISAKVLQKMKSVAEDYLGKVVKKAVVTVPAYFNIKQREATKRAAQIAGLDVLRIINEPEAAVMAFGFHQKSEQERNVLVFDLGGGTFDVSVVTQERGLIEVRAKRGDSSLGGSDFDNTMVMDCIQWFNEKFDVRDPVSNDHTTRPYHRLRRACEFAKCTLSQKDETIIRVEQFCNEENFYKSITRREFNEMNAEYFQRTIDIVKQALRDAKLSKEDVEEVLLVGGSTRILKIQEMLQEFFGGKDLNKTVNPDEAVAYGAAIQAAILDGQKSESLRDIQLWDVTPLSLGIAIKGGIQSTVIKPNTFIPCKNMKTYVTIHDNQTEVDISIFQGEHEFVKDNQFLGKIIVTDIPPAPAGVGKVDVTFEVDSDGILDVIATNKHNGKEILLTIKSASALSKEEVDNMVRRAAINKDEDRKERDRVLARNELESYAHWIAVMLKECAGSIGRVIGDRKLNLIRDACDDVLTWLNTHQEATKHEYTYQKDRIDAVCRDLPQKYKMPGNLPDELHTKYPVDFVSAASYHAINQDLD